MNMIHKIRKAKEYIVEALIILEALYLELPDKKGRFREIVRLLIRAVEKINYLLDSYKGAKYEFFKE